MYILHSQSRCAETDSELFLLKLFVIIGLVKGGGGGERLNGGRASPFPPLGETLIVVL